MIAALRTIDRTVTRHPWITVAVIFAVAAFARFIGTLGHPVPWIFSDEFAYIEMARNFGERGVFAIRDQSDYLSLVQTLLAAPGFALFGDTESAYVWIKAVNAIVMASAAFPAYGLARMVVSTRIALMFAGLVLAWPAFGYIHVVMTEPAYLPAFLLAVWMIARAVEEPSRSRQVLAIGAVFLCVGVRLQLAVLLVAVPIVCVAAAFLGGERRPGRLRRLASFWPMISLCLVVPLLGVMFQMLRGGSVRSLLGGYQQNDPGRVNIADMLPWLSRHIAVIGLALLFVPAAIGVATLLRFVRRGGTAAETGVFAAILVVVPLVLVQVATYASVYSLRVVERNMFVLEPLLLLTALAGIWTFGYSRIVAMVIAGGLTWAAFALPVAELLRPPPFGDTFSLLTLMTAAEDLGVEPQALIRVIAVTGVLATAALALWKSRHAAWVVGGVLLAALVWSSYEVTRLIHGYSTDVANVLVPKPYDWIDRAVGADARVALLWPADDTPSWVWHQEIWNRSLRSIVAIDSPVPVIGDRAGTFSTETGAYQPTAPHDPLPERLVVAPSRWQVMGDQVAQGRTAAIALTLWRITPPLRLAFHTKGVYADGWTGGQAEFRAYGCTPGVFSVAMVKGYGDTQDVTARASGEAPMTVTLSNRRTRRYSFPAKPDPVTGTCALTLDVPGALTADQVAGNGDPRVLGVIVQGPRFVAG